MSAGDNIILMPVRMEMMDGSRLDASLISPRALMKLHDLINRAELYVEAELLSGERVSFAKSSLKYIKMRETPKHKPLNMPQDSASGFDPYKILGVTPGMDVADIKHAYLELVRHYHPDKFETVDLPKEVAEYLGSMVRRINAAWDMLESSIGHKA